MTKLSQSFHKLQPFKTLVLGDFLLDTYTFGKVKRISPEAPVPILEVKRLEARPGGAGNVALNLQALGSNVYCMGRIGDDRNAKILKDLLKSTHIFLDDLVEEKGYVTIEKNRLIADSQQLLRIDQEDVCSMDLNLQKVVIDRLEKIIPSMDVIAISDYAKGFLSHEILQSAISIAKQYQIPVIVDPKGTDFTKYAGATILKPNLSEAYASVNQSKLESLDNVAKEIFKACFVDYLIITRSEAGISLFDRSLFREDFPVVSKEVVDVTGAGDTVLATLCLCVANRLPMAEAIQMANIAAGVAVEKLGCAQVSLGDIAERVLKLERASKVFEESDLLTKLQALQERSYKLLVLSQKNSISPNFFHHLRFCAKEPNENLVVYLQEGDQKGEFVSFLSHLTEIDSIIVKKENLQRLFEKTTPKDVFCLDGENLKKIDFDSV